MFIGWLIGTAIAGITVSTYPGLPSAVNILLGLSCSACGGMLGYALSRPRWENR